MLCVVQNSNYVNDTISNNSNGDGGVFFAGVCVCVVDQCRDVWHIMPCFDRWPQPRTSMMAMMVFTLLGIPVRQLGKFLWPRSCGHTAKQRLARLQKTPNQQIIRERSIDYQCTNGTMNN